jgi:pimeloyl-ACP methyl ester carboxylesterase
MAFVEANGLQLYYEDHGEGEPLICVMGLAADHLAWMFQVPVFSERYRTIVFDNRDVGQSSYADSDYETSDMAADVLALADALEIDSFHLLGVSLGGAISQQVALAAPERIRTLTLAVSFGGTGKYGHERARVWAELTKSIDRELHIDHLLLLTMTEEFFSSPEAVQLARQIMLNNPHPQSPDAFERQVRAAGHHEVRDRLGELQMPVHVIGAERDVLVPAFKSTELAKLIPNSRLTIVEGTAHTLNMERADLFNEAVLGFLAEHSESPAGAASNPGKGS